MNIVDTSGWLEYFAEGPNSANFSSPLQDVSSLVVFEDLPGVRFFPK